MAWHKGKVYCRECHYCGRLFDSVYPNAFYCSENCKEEGHRENKAAERQRKKLRDKINRQRRLVPQSLADINSRAISEGISYGNYVVKYGL